MTKIPLFLETTKSFQNIIPTYIRTGSTVSDLLSYILNQLSPFLNKENLLTIKLLEINSSNSAIEHTSIDGSKLIVPESGMMSYGTNNTPLIQKFIHYSKRQLTQMPVQISLLYTCFLYELTFPIYTILQKSEQNYHCHIVILSPKTE